MDRKITLSVHQLVDFLLRTGDIDNRIYNSATMQEGSRIHSYYQSKQGHNYLSEVPLLEKFNIEDFEITLEGRADGIILEDENEVTIDEIKSTITELESYFEEQKAWHLGQAKCYAMMYAHFKNLDHINIKLTYIHQLTNDKIVKIFHYKTTQLEQDISKLLLEYLDFYKLIYNRSEIRDESIKNLTFPFSKFRKGQRELAKYSYGIAKDGGILFCEAPTGIGKTISTLFPAIKSFANAKTEKIFYLTAKSSGKESAYQTVKLLEDKGLAASNIVIMAKDKICYCPGKACNPDECPFAKDYYTKIRKIIIESIKKFHDFSSERILSIASKNSICPFELSLDLSLYVDIIICDYNYFFNPLVYLKRYFDENASNMLVLVDEAHNLVERGRDMYSASFSLKEFKLAKKAVRHLEHKKIKNAIKRITKLFNQFEDYQEGDTIIQGLSSKDYNAIEAYLLASSDVNKHHHQFVNEAFKDFNFNLMSFSKLMDYYGDNFCLYITKNDNDIKISLFCIDPSDLLRRTLTKVNSKIIFSATLSPIDYYTSMLGGNESNPILMLPSPFNPNNLHLMIAPSVSTRYKKRDETLLQVADYIKEVIDGKLGNYLIYAPSYEYISKLKPLLKFDSEVNLLIQEKDMTENDKNNFLTFFADNPSITTVGLVVVGGAFGEGIDLVNERLIGVVVIGVGLPTICFEREIIKNYFNSINKDGFSYSYTNPGMNRVMQAVGRVIRSENDHGVALLIDDRYLNANYRDLFKNEWGNYKVVTSKEDVKNEVLHFWKD